MKWNVVSVLTLFFSYLTFSCAGKSNEKTLSHLTIPATLASGVNSTVSIIFCPDGSECDLGETCCPYIGGGYACCAYGPFAQCCADHKTCCPSGTICDSRQHTCIGAQYKYISCPDGCSCSRYQTCCQYSDGLHGCCPYPDAVCCSDQEHCCPYGHRCDLTTQMCVLGNVQLPVLQKTECFHRKETRKVKINEILRFKPLSVQDRDHVADDMQQ